MFVVEWVERLCRRLLLVRPAHWLLLVLGFALALRVIFFIGLCVADDFTYCRFANTILRGEPYFSAGSEFRSLRWPVVLPVIPSFWLFGVSDAAAVWGSLSYSLGGIVALFLIGRRLFGDRVGLYAALLLAVFPGDTLFATQLMPDGAIPFFMGLSVLFFLKGEDAVGRRAAGFYGMCGVAMAGAFLCRVTAVYFFLFFACLMLARRRPERGAWLTFVAFGVTLGLLYSFYYVKTGDLLYELSLLRKIRASVEGTHYVSPPQFTRNLGYMVPIIYSQVEPLNPGLGYLYGIRAHTFMASRYLFGFFYYFIFPCFFYWAFKMWREARPAAQGPAEGGRTRSKGRASFASRWGACLSTPLSIPVLWLLITYLYGEFGTINLSKYQQLAKLPRFLLVQTMPGLLLVALWMDRLIHGGKDVRRTWARVACGVGSLLFLVVTSLGVLQRETAGSLGHIAPYREAYALLKDRPRKDLFVTGGWWPLRMSHYFGRENGYIDPPGGPRNRLKLLRGLRDVRDVRDAYAIVDRNPFLGVGDFKFSYSEYPPFVERIPSHWQRLGAFHNIEVYYAPQEVPSAVAEVYHLDFSTWEGAKAALERAVREKDFEIFRSYLSDKFKSTYNDEQLRNMFGILLRSPNAVGQLEKKHFFEEGGRWRLSLTVEQAKGQGPSVVVR